MTRVDACTAKQPHHSQALAPPRRFRERLHGKKTIPGKNATPTLTSVEFSHDADAGDRHSESATTAKAAVAREEGAIAVGRWGGLRTGKKGGRVV